MIKERMKIVLLLMVCMLGCGCGSKSTVEISEAPIQEETKQITNQIFVEDSSESEEISNASEMTEEKSYLSFVDVFGQEYQVEINSAIEKQEYKETCFKRNGLKLSYEGDERYSFRLGIDVSHHQGTIDWKQVKAAGYEFAFIRIGYRGYGESGTINLDREFANNIKNAQAAGIDVGVYFFAQAVNEEEAREEALFVLEQLEGYELQLPVVYDPESILDDEARTDDVSGEQFTKNTQVFCDIIGQAGYEAMIYSNMLWEAYEFDLEQLTEYQIWYADYELLPQTPYKFRYWQYTNEGYVDGISGMVDLNIELIPIK